MSPPTGRWFITGTDTEIGKTMVTACMAAAAATRGTVVAAKPVASGATPDEPLRDAAVLARAAGHAPREWALAPEPLSPHRAFPADAIDERSLKAWVDALCADTILIEGVGGWRVPLRAGASPLEVCDLAAMCEAGIVMVAPNRIGVINHTRLTWEAIRSDGLHVRAVILNEHHASAADPSCATNKEDLESWLDVPVISFPRLPAQPSPSWIDAGNQIWDLLAC